MLHATLADQSWVDDLGPIEGVRTSVWDLRGPAPRTPIDVVVAPYQGAAEVIGAVGQVPSVRLVQLLTAGYDGILEQVPDRVAVANAAGVHDASTAELALALVLAAQRGLPGFVRAQDQGVWGPRPFLPSLADRRVLVVGYGQVGRAIARRLMPFEARLTAVASRARAGDDLVDAVHGIDELLKLLPDTEIAIVVTPLSPDTEGLIGEGFLAALPDDALVVNVARGPVADTAAILRHTGRLRFALDVTDPEPLPEGHPLWHAEGVLITPHVGGVSTAFRPRALALLREQLTRLAAGDEPDHVVGQGSASSAKPAWG